MTTSINWPSDKSCRAKLAKIKAEHPISIRTDVAAIALATSYANVGGFFRDLQNHGCVSGMIADLVYYTDTHRFFDHHYAEIDELREACEEQLGQSLTINGDLKNTLAWFAFEETAHTIVQEMNLEI